MDRRLVLQLADLAFTDQAHNVVLAGGPGTGKNHLAAGTGVAGIMVFAPFREPDLGDLCP